MIGQTITHYRVLEKIGQGGMGEVYLAEDDSLHRQVALKFLPVPLERDATARQRFLREARSAAALDHPYICHIHEVGEHDGRHFIAMEYVAGRTLAQRLAEGPLETGEALRLAIEIAEALETAHDHNIVHRDLKPANIVITEGGHAKVMDFGLAKKVLALDDEEEDTLTELTREGSTLGTVPYMSPEQVRAEAVDVRTDIFSFGIILYEMLTGAHPFRRPKAMDTATSILRDDPVPLADLEVDRAGVWQPLIDRLLAKEAAARFSSGGELLARLRSVAAALAPQLRGGQLSRRAVAGGALAVIAVLAAGIFWYLERQADIRFARTELLAEIESLVDEEWRDYTRAYEMAVAAEQIIPDDPRLAEVFERISLPLSVDTEPRGANVFYKKYDSPNDEWILLGVTPVEGVRMPIGFFRWKLEKEGYETVYAADATWVVVPGAERLMSPARLFRRLDPAGELPDGMVRVQGSATPAGEVADFFIDRLEVTNRQFKDFVDAGGYENETFWRYPFLDGDRELSRAEAMSRFVDRTGRPGPAAWEAGDYPAGRESYPVTGISWYEAAAFAAFHGRVLPTVTHWGLARGEVTSMVRFPQMGGFALFEPFSNFSGRGPVEAGSLPGVTPFGVADMAGNVREWCFNQTGDGRAVRGGAWDSATYMFADISQLPPLDRSPENGFRCALYTEEEPPGATLGPAPTLSFRDYRDVQPVSDEVFETFRDRFRYDPADLNSDIEWRRETDEWVEEKVTFDATYDGERMLAHLFLPRSAAAPYQAVIYFPGSAARFQESADDLPHYFELPIFTEFLIKSGRTLVFPVYQGTFERRGTSRGRDLLHLGSSTREYAEWVFRMGQDLRRTLDYLETRDDIDASRFAYYGMSWGSLLGGILPAVDDRIRTVVLLSGGINPVPVRPEVDMVHYLPRTTVPTLMLNGRYDLILPADKSIFPMFELLGTPQKDKELKLFETDHIPPKTEFIRETLGWLDKYLGPVRRESAGSEQEPGAG